MANRLQPTHPVSLVWRRSARAGKEGFCSSHLDPHICVSGLLFLLRSKQSKETGCAWRKKEWQCSAVKHCMCYCFQFGKSWIQIEKLLTKQSHATNSQTHFKSAKSSMKCFSLNSPQTPGSVMSADQGLMSQKWLPSESHLEKQNALSHSCLCRLACGGWRWGDHLARDPQPPPPPLHSVSVRIIR